MIQGPPNDQSKKTQTAPLELVIGHIAYNKERKKKQFSLSTKTLEQIDYMHYKMNQQQPTSLSAVIEQAVSSYYALYRFVEDQKERDESTINK